MNLIFESKRPVGQNSIVRAWVSELEPRMQGVLLTAIRGVDTSPRESSIKSLARIYRATVIHGKNDQPQTFLRVIDYDDATWVDAEVRFLMDEVLRDHDAYPHHYLMHLIHAAQIVGYCHPHIYCAVVWATFYQQFCRKMHMQPERFVDLHARLAEPSESAFAAAQ